MNNHFLNVYHAPDNPTWLTFPALPPPDLTHRKDSRVYTEDVVPDAIHSIPSVLSSSEDLRTVSEWILQY